MPLNLYRRHRQECEGGCTEESRSGEFEERKKGWRKCACFIFASGTLAGKFKRKYTGKATWDEAKTVAAEWEKAGSWDSKVIVPEPIPESKQQHRITIEQATKVFLGELRETAAFATHKKYRLLLKRLSAFSEQRGYLVIAQWEPVDVRQFRSTWLLSPPTAVRRMAMQKPFFEYCVANEWIARNPARLVKNPKGRELSVKPRSEPVVERLITRRPHWR